MRLKEVYLADAARARSRVGELVALLFANPFVTVRRVEAPPIYSRGARSEVSETAASTRDA